VKIEGDYTFRASRELVWSLLHDPATIRLALPGCEEIDQTAPADYIAALRVQNGPLKGRYRGQVQLIDAELHDRFAITVDGEGPDGTISGNGMLILNEQDGATTVQYAGDVEFSGPTAQESPRLIQTITNSLIRQFFEAVDYQVRIQTGIHTTSLPGTVSRAHPSGAAGAQDATARAKRDRQTIWIVVVLIAFTFFTFTGVFMILLLLVRWGKRTFDRRVLAAVHEQQQGSEIPASP
jgi:carbon monoxide dehydrogenase subunit G